MADTSGLVLASVLYWMVHQYDRVPFWRDPLVELYALQSRLRGIPYSLSPRSGANHENLMAQSTVGLGKVRALASYGLETSLR